MCQVTLFQLLLFYPQSVIRLYVSFVFVSSRLNTKMAQRDIFRVLFCLMTDWGSIPCTFACGLGHAGDAVLPATSNVSTMPGTWHSTASSSASSS